MAQLRIPLGKTPLSRHIRKAYLRPIQEPLNLRIRSAAGLVLHSSPAAVLRNDAHGGPSYRGDRDEPFISGGAG